MAPVCELLDWTRGGIGAPKAGLTPATAAKTITASGDEFTTASHPLPARQPAVRLEAAMAESDGRWRVLSLPRQGVVQVAYSSSDYRKG